MYNDEEMKIEIRLKISDATLAITEIRKLLKSQYIRTKSVMSDKTFFTIKSNDFSVSYPIEKYVNSNAGWYMAERNHVKGNAPKMIRCLKDYIKDLNRQYDTIVRMEK